MLPTVAIARIARLGCRIAAGPASAALAKSGPPCGAPRLRNGYRLGKVPDQSRRGVFFLVFVRPLA